MTQRDRNAGKRTAGSPKSIDEDFGTQAPAPMPNPAGGQHRRQMRQEAPNAAHATPPSGALQQGMARPPRQQGGDYQGPQHGDERQAPSDAEHAGQFGYSQGGGAHDNWGAFDGSQERQSPGYGQDEPWQHAHDADYLRWREEHLRQLDEEYANWRRERYGKFSDEFSQWRDSRLGAASTSTSPHETEADEKVVEDRTVPKRKLK